MTVFQVCRSALAETRVVDQPLAPGLGEAVLSIEAFALTANTVTYAVHGDALGYWRFWPAADGWGNVPAWAIATVIASRAAGLAEGARVYGFFAMAGAVLLQPGRIGSSGFNEVSPHRAELAAVYNRYRLWDDAVDGCARLAAVLQPLHATAFLLDDFLADSGFFAADSVIVSSGSSKTAIAIAHAIGQRAMRPELVALTSPGNVAFTRATGAYDRVLGYAEVGAEDAGRAAIYVDIAGDRALRQRIHGHWRDRLVHSAAVGDTHQNLGLTSAPLDGPRPQFFFAPTWLSKRQADWGAGGAAMRLETAWRTFAAFAPGWLTLVEERGAAAAVAHWAEALAGRTPPDTGVVLALD